MTMSSWSRKPTLAVSEYLRFEDIRETLTLIARLAPPKRECVGLETFLKQQQIAKRRCVRGRRERRRRPSPRNSPR
jgi:hypothetical protein